MPFPRFVAIFNWNVISYLEYEANEGSWQTRVRLSSPMVLSETNFTRFEFVQSNLDPTNMIHIRTTYNNKFLQRSPDSDFLVAIADEPEEDRAKRSCTLFRINILRGSEFDLALVSENREHFVRMLDSDGRSLRIVPNSGQRDLILTFTDVEKLVLLPRNITLQGDNGMYLSGGNNNNMLQFNSGDPLHPDAWHVSVPRFNGDVRIRSSSNDMFWRMGDSSRWINNDGGAGEWSSNNTFRPVRLSFEDNKISLLQLRNNLYLRRWGRHNTGNDRLDASANNIIPEAIFTVQEAVRDREIYNIRYRLNQKRIYDVAPVYIAPQTVDNYSDLEATTTVRYQYQKMTEETFNSSHSWKVSLQARLSVPIIPKLVGLHVSLEAAYSGNVEWSKTNRTEQTTTSETTVVVPPRSRVLVTMYIEQGTIDVPYSYTQRDILVNGNHEIRTLHDGIFTGVNSDIMYYHISEPEALPQNAADYQGKGPNIVISPYDVRQHYDKYLRKTAISPTISMDENKEEDGKNATNALPSKL